MTSKKASRNMLLNWLVRSKKTAARVGRLPVDVPTSQSREWVTKKQSGDEMD
jgi:hypothetical protein